MGTRKSSAEKALHARLDKHVQAFRSSEGSLRRQMRSVRKDGWTLRRRTVFLDALRQTCNVAESARLVDMSVAGAYDLRKRDPVFAELWEEAKERAYEELELRAMALVGNTMEEVHITRDGEGPDAAVKSVKTISRMSIDKLLKLLAAHRASVAQYRMQRAGLEADGTTRAHMQAKLAAVRACLEEDAAAAGVGVPAFPSS